MDNPNQASQTQQPLNPTTPTVNSSKSKVIPVIFGVAAVIAVAIGAYLLGTKQSQTPVQNIVQTTPIPTPTPDPTANWKTYQINGFSIKYPDSWYQKENPDFQKPNITPDALETKVSIANSQSFLLGTTDYPKDGCRVDLLIANIDKDPAQLIKDDRYKTIGSLSSPTIDSTFFINGVTGIKRDYLPDNKANFTYASVILLPGKQNIFAFYLMKGNKALDTVCEETLDQILATFKFTSP